MSKWEQFDEIAARQRAEWDKVPEDDVPPVYTVETYDTARLRTLFEAWLKTQGVDWREANRHVGRICRSAHRDGDAQAKGEFWGFAQILRSSGGTRDNYIAGKLFEIIRGQEDEDDLR